MKFTMFSKLQVLVRYIIDTPLFIIEVGKLEKSQKLRQQLCPELIIKLEFDDEYIHEKQK